jgi:hypothetical protein
MQLVPLQNGDQKILDWLDEQRGEAEEDQDNQRHM